MLIREIETPMRNGLFLIGGSLLQIRNWLFLIRVCLPLMKEKQLLSGGWILLFKESLSIGALREGYRDMQF